MQRYELIHVDDRQDKLYRVQPSCSLTGQSTYILEEFRGLTLTLRTTIQVKRVDQFRALHNIRLGGKNG